MSYTDQELEISNKSYTNKDFNTIYPELLDLVKKLTNKWDPTTSNESDPGVVLLKLWAILADKNNYNIDKNILETFPLSVTQRANAQKLYDMLGYSMHHYMSAITDVTLYYIGNILNIKDKDDITRLDSLTVPKFTMVTDDSGENVFTLLDDVKFSIRTVPVISKAIQGTIHDYEVNGITDITLDNLDSEYRLFFTENRIAENGIFIANKGLGTLNYEEWKKVSNLESATLNSKIYKFGVLPNTQSCYIQFPQDIGTLIGNGLKIKYIISDGESGNIQANQLTTFNGEVVPFELQDAQIEGNADYSEYYNTSINQDVIIKNDNSTSNGADPEDLDSAYKNYKKTIGTFNTLVTVEDYEKAIYQLVDDLGLPFCSNVVVSDRTNDINYSTNVVTLNGNSVETQLVVDQILEPVEVWDKDGSAINNDNNTHYIKTPKMSAFNLGLYVLNPMLDIEDETGYYYNRSFSVHSAYKDIINQISEVDTTGTSTSVYKSAQHDFIETTGSNIVTGMSRDSSGKLPYVFKNFYKLTGKIVTYYKVTEKEAEDIEKNIKLALFRDYNARNVSFGEPIKYENIVKTIENADTRIKTLILNEPEYDLRYMAGDDYYGSLEASIPLPLSNNHQSTTPAFTKDLMYKLLLKMVLSGHVQLYDFNNDIKFDFGQTKIKKHANIKYITTESSISLEGSNVMGENATGYKVAKNNNLQLYAPNFYTTTIYSAYVNYYFDSSNKDCPANGFKSNTYYTLPLGMEIQLQYTDENGIVKTPKIAGGTKFRFVDSGDSNATLKMNNITIKKEIGGNSIDMCTLTATQQIEIIEVNEVTFPKQGDSQSILYCMWFTNRATTNEDKGQKITEYVLFDENESQHILQDNEYFLYTNSDKNELVVLGSGTMLARSPQYKEAIVCKTKIPATSILENGQRAISDGDWYRYPLSELNGVDRSLKLVELQIITLGEGAGFKFDSKADGDANLKISSTPIKVTNPQYCEEFKDSGENTWTVLDDYQLSTTDNDWYYKGWQIVSKLNSVINPTTPQSLGDDEEIKVINGEGSETKLEGNILANTILMFGGGSNLEIFSSNGEDINIYSYTEVKLPSIVLNENETADIVRGDDGYISIMLKDWVRYKDGNIIKYSVGDTSRPFNNRMFPLAFADGSEASSIVAVTLNGRNSEAKIGVYLKDGNLHKDTSNKDAFYKDGIYTLNHQNQSQYIQLPADIDHIELINFKFTNNDGLEVSDDNSDHSWDSISDILRIGYPKIKSVEGYSTQIKTTLEYIYGKNYSTNSLCTDPVEYIQENYKDFNLTYEVTGEDLIDGKVGPRSNWDNLFAGDLIWDKNHICNKYTIPQYDFENSSVEIAPHMIKG